MIVDCFVSSPEPIPRPPTPGLVFSAIVDGKTRRVFIVSAHSREPYCLYCLDLQSGDSMWWDIRRGYGNLTDIRFHPNAKVVCGD